MVFGSFFDRFSSKEKEGMEKVMEEIGKIIGDGQCDDLIDIKMKLKDVVDVIERLSVGGDPSGTAFNANPEEKNSFTLIDQSTNVKYYFQIMQGGNSEDEMVFAILPQTNDGHKTMDLLDDVYVARSV